MQNNSIYQILVNKQNPIPKNWNDNITLVEIVKIDNENAFLEENTYNQFCKLKKFLEQFQIQVGIESGYRSVLYQQELYERFIEQYGKEYADAVVAPPTTSEHHTGLALDMNIFIDNRWPETNYEVMKYQKIFEMIHPYLHLFGFILRYPNGKEKITGYPYEPWHIRYVGIDIAKEIYQNNWTLEEFYKMKNIDKIL